MTLSAPVMAQDFQKGLAAAQAGDFATALKEWKPLAEAGDAKSQNKLAAQRHAAKVGRRVMGELKRLEGQLEDAGIMPDD